jgi:hypothetical protein
MRSTQTDRTLLTDIRLHEILPDGIPPICCTKDMEIGASLGEWICESCDAFVGTVNGVVVDLDR